VKRSQKLCWETGKELKNMSTAPKYNTYSKLFTSFSSQQIDFSRRKSGERIEKRRKNCNNFHSLAHKNHQSLSFPTGRYVVQRLLYQRNERMIIIFRVNPHTHTYTHLAVRALGRERAIKNSVTNFGIKIHNLKARATDKSNFVAKVTPTTW
jgi:hypothetical protein